jgi:hypothetical protein
VQDETRLDLSAHPQRAHQHEYEAADYDGNSGSVAATISQNNQLVYQEEQYFSNQTCI